MKANLVEKQESFSLFWKQNSIYYKRLDLNKGKPEYRLLDGPPYANGAIHMGHAFNKVLKDFVIRWKNISGFKCDFTPGWDVHGLPIENKVEKDVRGFKSLSALEKMKVSSDFARSQVDLQKTQLSKLNICCPMDQIYLTSDQKFIENEYFLFLRLWEEGLITRELKPVAWSYSSKTALAESELIYEEVECDSIFFSWEIVDSNTSSLNGVNLILWTTTPYSLEANLAVAFNPEWVYSVFNYEEKCYLASDNFISDIGQTLGWEREKIKDQRKVTLRDLKKIRYRNNLTGEINPVFSATFLVEGMGSGFVHLAPGLGEDDYLICRENNLAPYCVINEEGYFHKQTKFSPIAGKFYQDASKIIISFLLESKNLILVQKIRHKNAKDWRTGLPTFYRATQQWFLNLEKLRERLERAFEESGYVTHPRWLLEKLRETIFTRKEWCLSRQRIWGVPIPVIFKNGEAYGGLKQLRKNISILLAKGIEAWHSTPIEDFLESYDLIENFDSFSKCKDVLDVWFDSGSAFFLFKDELSDLYIEGSDQLRGWFNSSTILSVVMNGKLPFKRLAAHGFILDESGLKMSKSKGNVIDPIKIVSSSGSDIFRFWVANSNFLKDIRFSQHQLISVEQKYRKFRNILFRFSLSILDNFDWNSVKISGWKPQRLPNQYLLWYFSKLLKESCDNFEELNFQKIVNSFSEFVELYSAWYLELVKPILYSRKESDSYKKEILEVISVVFKYSLQILSIFIPQTAEEVYGYLNFPSKKEALWLEDFQISEIDCVYEIYQECWNHFFRVRAKVLVKLEEQYETREISTTREAKVLLPSELVRYFELSEWADLLNVAEVEESIQEEIQVQRSNNFKCPRCLLYFESQSLNSIILREEKHLVCSFCRNILGEYRNDTGSESIGKYN